LDYVQHFGGCNVIVKRQLNSKRDCFHAALTCSGNTNTFRDSSCKSSVELERPQCGQLQDVSASQ
jgi:hypothetical protein